jgi:hypothetical protein
MWKDFGNIPPLKSQSNIMFKNITFVILKNKSIEIFLCDLMLKFLLNLAKINQCSQCL